MHFRTETENRFTIEYISLGYGPDDEAAFARALGCEVKTRAGWDGLVVPLETWRRPLRRRDPLLRHFLETQADQILARLPARTGIADDVQRALARSLDARSTRIGTFARQLAMSGQTLQRRLAAEGVSYQQLLEDARREAAARHLADSGLAICEIAYLLGYSEPAPFHRAFKRWYGTTPEMWRQTRRPQPV